jgi:ribosomal protein S9
MSPLILTDMFDKVDVEATLVEGPGGTTSTARAIRHGLSLGLAALYPEFKQRLRFGKYFQHTFQLMPFILAGYLNIDPRSKERSKISQPGARAKWIWKKR